jgi:hypothetical protein
MVGVTIHQGLDLFEGELESDLLAVASAHTPHHLPRIAPGSRWSHNLSEECAVLVTVVALRVALVGDIEVKCFRHVDYPTGSAQHTLVGGGKLESTIAASATLMSAGYFGWFGGIRALLQMHHTAVPIIGEHVLNNVEFWLGVHG